MTRIATPAAPSISEFRNRKPLAVMKTFIGYTPQLAEKPLIWRPRIVTRSASTRKRFCVAGRETRTEPFAESWADM